MVEEDANPYKLAFGWDSPYLHSTTNSKMNETFNTAMRSWSKLHNSIFAHHYHGFKDVKSLVDAGGLGGVGGALALIVAANPHIRGFNFDLPHAISTAPETPVKYQSLKWNCDVSTHAIR